MADQGRIPTKVFWHDGKDYTFDSNSSVVKIIVSEKELNGWNSLSAENKEPSIASAVRLLILKGSKGDPVPKALIKENIDKNCKKYFNALLSEVQTSLFEVFGYYMCSAPAVTELEAPGAVIANDSNNRMGIVLATGGEEMPPASTGAGATNATPITSTFFYELLSAIQSGSRVTYLSSQELRAAGCDAPDSHDVTAGRWLIDRGLVNDDGTTVASAYKVLQIIWMSANRIASDFDILQGVRNIDPRFTATAYVGQASAQVASIPELDNDFFGLLNQMRKEGYITVVTEKNTPLNVAPPMENGRKLTRYTLSTRFHLEFGVNNLIKAYFQVIRDIPNNGKRKFDEWTENAVCDAVNVVRDELKIRTR